MSQFLANHFSELLSFLAGLVSGWAITLSVSSKRVRGSGSLVDQSGASAGGDVDGGNKNSR